MSKVGQNNFLLKLPILAVAIISVICAAPLMAQDGRYALLIQKSPEYGGVVTPVEGLQMAFGNQLVTVTATPRDGYEFVYWLGEVTDPTNSITTVLVDSPKMVIAVFERPERENHSSDSTPGGVSRGGQRSTGGVAARSRPQPSGGSAGPVTVVNPRQPPIIYIIVDDPDDPEVPEPATMLLLGAGAIMLMKRKYRKRC